MLSNTFIDIVLLRNDKFYDQYKCLCCLYSVSMYKSLSCLQCIKQETNGFGRYWEELKCYVRITFSNMYLLLFDPCALLTKPRVSVCQCLILLTLYALLVPTSDIALTFSHCKQSTETTNNYSFSCTTDGTRQVVTSWIHGKIRFRVAIC